MAFKILIVDDSLLARTALKRIIDMVDLDVESLHEAGTGVEALEILDSNEVDLVLADLNMPQMNGVELVHRMKEDSRLTRIPVVVVSTESSPGRIKELLSEGIKDFLHKPFTPEEFRSVILRNIEVCHDRM
jgi:two-component system chemotaxis response regulator CheY